MRLAEVIFAYFGTRFGTRNSSCLWRTRCLREGVARRPRMTGEMGTDEEVGERPLLLLAQAGGGLQPRGVLGRDRRSRTSSECSPAGHIDCCIRARVHRAHLAVPVAAGRVDPLRHHGRVSGRLTPRRPLRRTTSRMSDERQFWPCEYVSPKLASRYSTQGSKVVAGEMRPFHALRDSEVASAGLLRHEESGGAPARWGGGTSCRCRGSPRCSHAPVIRERISG